MNKEQEAQQAQTIAKIKKKLKSWAEYDIGHFVNGCEMLLEILEDRKRNEILQMLIARASAEMNFAAIIYRDAHKDPRIIATEFSQDLFKCVEDYIGDSQAQKIAEQEKEIERLKAQNGVGADDVRWVVNSIGELGVEIFGKGYFLYKGHSYMPNYPWRGVFKREFGECCISPLYESQAPSFVLGFPAAPEQTTDSKEGKQMEGT